MQQQAANMPKQFLPDLCRLPVMLAVMLVTELLVIVYVFSLSALGTFDWERLSLLSLYAQWIALLSIGGLCRLRPLLNSQTPSRAGLMSFGWILLVALLANIAAQWIYGGAKSSSISMPWLLRDGIIVAVLAAVGLRYMYVQQGWQAEQKATHSARVDALHARIRPHFLFNSMNTIASLISYAPADAEKAVEDLAAMFRASLSQSDVLVPWHKELEVCQAYLRIEQQRLGPRLAVDWQLADISDDFQLPPLTLQPLIENAIYHGIESHPAGGTLIIKTTAEQNMLHISVENPCFENGDSAGNAAASDDKNHNGIALDNIRARLAAIYKPSVSTYSSPKPSDQKADLKLTRSPSAFTASLCVPLHFELEDINPTNGKPMPKNN